MNWSLVLVLVLCGISMSFGDGQSPVFWGTRNLDDYGNVQFSGMKGGLMCFSYEQTECLMKFTDKNFCLNSVYVLACMKQKAVACDVEKSSLVADVQLRLANICQKGTKLNNDYLKHETCMFGIAVPPVLSCLQDVNNELEKTPKDPLKYFKVTCRYADSVDLCMNTKMDETCGEEAGVFYRKLKDPSNKLNAEACNGATSFNFISTLLFQASAVLFTLKFSKNYV